MNLEERIIDGMEELVGKLQRGERVMVTTLEKCVCDRTGPITKGKGTQCHLCGGVGFLRSARTWTAASTK